MAVLRVSKVISALPVILEPDTIYYVRVGAGFDQYVTDSTGAVAFTQNAVAAVGSSIGQQIAMRNNHFPF